MHLRWQQQLLRLRLGVRLTVLRLLKLCLVRRLMQQRQQLYGRLLLWPKRLSPRGFVLRLRLLRVGVCHRRSWLRWRLRMRLRCLRCARRLMRGLRWRLRRHMRECCGRRKLLLLLLRLVVAT